MPAFTAEQQEKAHQLLGAKVAYMMGRKMEEGDWADVYCKAKGLPNHGWSNLKLDVVYENLGVEHKMMCRPSKRSLTESCGTTIMHPSATRSIRVPPNSTPADDAMRDILTQYGDYLLARKEEVRKNAPAGTEPDMRIGWLLWQDNLHQFLYFEEEMMIPNPDDYYARWEVRVSKSVRKGSTNLWIYEKDTDKKRYSITTEAGAKVQPYFDVPPVGHPHLYVFNVIGEVITTELVRLWATEATARELRRILGDLLPETLSRSILAEAPVILRDDQQGQGNEQVAEALLISLEAYDALRLALPDTVSDEHSLQLFAQHLRHKQ
ncbi:hypothetical protein [Hymenobacter perfusus]|uniref:Uncharacterized protein n=1 Tax=Hymenobacter perfusus TaxID=1236770 RepID=A0A3R9MBX3_9BACT|nr:hypothetical protein [Hymenobacter perfusus]RSK38334.1 hypothetical protein EI293_21895 [Hymenobacter perfusus]